MPKIVRLSFFAFCLLLTVVALGGRADADDEPCTDGAVLSFPSGSCCHDGMFGWDDHQQLEVYVCEDGGWFWQGFDCGGQLC